MTSEKLANQLEKLHAKLESFTYKFADNKLQLDFDFMKADVLSLLEEMEQLANEDAEAEEPQEEEDKDE